MLHIDVFKITFLKYYVWPENYLHIGECQYHNVLPNRFKKNCRRNHTDKIVVGIESGLLENRPNRTPKTLCRSSFLLNRNNLLRNDKIANLFITNNSLQYKFFLATILVHCHYEMFQPVKHLKRLNWRGIAPVLD